MTQDEASIGLKRLGRERKVSDVALTIMMITAISLFSSVLVVPFSNLVIVLALSFVLFQISKGIEFKRRNAELWLDIRNLQGLGSTEEEYF